MIYVTCFRGRDINNDTLIWHQFVSAAASSTDIDYLRIKVQKNLSNLRKIVYVIK